MTSVIVALGNAVWEPQFLSALNHPMSGIQVFRRCVDGVDVRASAQVHKVDAVLVSDDTLRIDAQLVAELQSLNVRVIALSSDQTYWATLGVHECIIVDVRKVSDSIGQLVDVLHNNYEKNNDEVQSNGQLVAVASFGGGVGRSLIARELSFSFSQKAHRTVLVEADTYGPSLSQYFQLPLEGFHFLDLCRGSNKHIDGNDQESMFSDSVIQFSEQLYLVPGIPRTSLWVDLRLDALRRTFANLRNDFDFTVVDAGPVLESDFGASIDAGLPHRQAATLVTVEQAGTLIFCVRSDTASVTRFIKHYLELSDMFAHADVQVVLSDVFGSRNLNDYLDSLHRYAGIANVFGVGNVGSELGKAEKRQQFIGQLFPNSELVKLCQSITTNVNNAEQVPDAQTKLQQIIARSKVA